jgi:hypothetical protein
MGTHRPRDGLRARLDGGAAICRDTLLLKGLTHKEIAEARSTTETTIRQQALALYRKSGLRSRAELSAFFLEDLLRPIAQR